MKKVILSGVMAIALMCSTSVMAQNGNASKCCPKAKTETNKDCPTKKGDCTKKECPKSECEKPCTAKKKGECKDK